MIRLPHPLPLPTWALLALLSGCQPLPAPAHDIYSGLRGKGNQLCCGGSDCNLTIYRERGDFYEFLTRENTWVPLPQDRITFLPVPGDTSNTSHAAHLCYRPATDYDRSGDHNQNVFGDIYLYCAFINPGSI